MLHSSVHVRFCPEKVFVLFEANLKTIIIPVFELCISPGTGSQALPVPSASVTLQQLGDEIAVSWDACQSKSVVDRYVPVPQHPCVEPEGLWL